MENALDRFDALLKEHAYEALSEEQKEWVKQFVTSAEEYNSMRRAGQALEDHFSPDPQIVPSPDVLASLKKQYHQRSEERQQSRWSVPAWAAVLALFIAGGTGWYAGTTSGAREVYVDRIVSKTDTVRIASRPDTVVIEHVVYRQAPTLISVSGSQPPSVLLPSVKGVSMKEKEELEKLLVSGGL